MHNLKFIYLCHGEIAYSGLKYLLEHNIYPDYTIIHKDRNKFPSQLSYFSKIDNIHKEYNFNLIESNSLTEHKELFLKSAIAICVGYMEIISEEIFSSPDLGTLNIHCGKLPEYRGRAPICRAIMNGDNKLIITIHKVNSKVDGGDILKEYPLEINDYDTSNILYEKCKSGIGEILIGLLSFLNLHTEDINRYYIPQRTAEIKPYKSLTEKERLIDFGKSVKEIHNLIRALSPPYPMAILKAKDKTLYVCKSEYAFTKSELRTGTIIYVNKDNLKIRCTDGDLIISEILDENKEKINLINNFEVGDNLI